MKEEMGITLNYIKTVTELLNTPNKPKHFVIIWAYAYLATRREEFWESTDTLKGTYKSWNVDWNIPKN